MLGVRSSGLERLQGLAVLGAEDVGMILCLNPCKNVKHLVVVKKAPGLRA